MERVAAVERRRGVNLLQYFDDWLIHQQSKRLLMQNLGTVWQTVTRLGLIPNVEKSELVPTQDFNYVGMNFMTALGIVRVPLDRVQNVLTLVFSILDVVEISARKYLSLLGTLNATAEFIILGRLHLRPLQFYLLFHWVAHRCSLDMSIPLSRDFKRHLRWWAKRDRYLAGVLMSQPEPELFLTTDASKVGWGAHLEPLGLMFQGTWSVEQSKNIVNMLELRAVSLALNQAVHKVAGKVIQVSTDNTTVVAYLNKQGGDTFSPSLLGDNEPVELVSKQRHSAANTSHNRQIQHIGRLPLEEHDSSTNRMVFKERHCVGSHKEMGGPNV